MNKKTQTFLQIFLHQQHTDLNYHLADASKISVKAVVSQGRSIFAYVPLPENSAWGDIRITLMDESGKVFQENDVPEGTVVPVEAGRITRLPAVTFPAEIYFALDPSDNDFSLWNSYPNLNPDRKWSPWTWRGSWMGEYVYSHDEENTPCKEVKLFSDEKYIYGYVKVDLDLRHYSSGDKMNTDPMLNNFYVMIDNDDVTTGQSFGGNNIANVPTYRGYNLMLYGKACTGSVPGEWRPSCYDCTVDAGASNTNFRGELLEDVLDAAYGGGSVDGDILQWEFIIDKSKVGLFGRTTHNICISFCDSPNSNNTMMPSISGIVIDL
mgnify:CR=1 FL=1